MLCPHILHDIIKHMAKHSEFLVTFFWCDLAGELLFELHKENTIKINCGVMQKYKTQKVINKIYQRERKKII